jgi:hypothetical protein
MGRFFVETDGIGVESFSKMTAIRAPATVVRC